ncbi:transmembrane protein 104 isoform X3 [Pipistrellus kuhlii]|uniref:transmembrane protein 104 isoform X3 n=1 Tax=Pipistrellus kuhlii TaxID=59472 RepID=UPI001E271896|nr:transmembrane protein 104 isoform X3 [Pipistrellus kuhlii]
MAGEITETGELYSPYVGLVYMFNLIVGTGALTMPKAFASAGWLVSLVLLVFLGFMSFVTTTFVVEAMAAANAQLRWKRMENHQMTTTPPRPLTATASRTTTSGRSGGPSSLCRDMDLQTCLKSQTGWKWDRWPPCSSVKWGSTCSTSASSFTCTGTWPSTPPPCPSPSCRCPARQGGHSEPLFSLSAAPLATTPAGWRPTPGTTTRPPAGGACAAWTSTASTCFHHHDRAGPGPHRARARGGAPAAGRPLGRPEPVRGVRVLLHVPALAAVPPHARLLQAPPHAPRAPGLRAHPGLLQPALLHRHLLLPRRQPAGHVHPQLRALRRGERGRRALLPGPLPRLHHQHQLPHHRRDAAQQLEDALPPRGRHLPLGGGPRGLPHPHPGAPGAGGLLHPRPGVPGGHHGCLRGHGHPVRDPRLPGVPLPQGRPAGPGPARRQPAPVPVPPRLLGGLRAALGLLLLPLRHRQHRPQRDQGLRAGVCRREGRGPRPPACRGRVWVPPGPPRGTGGQAPGGDPAQ